MKYAIFKRSDGRIVRIVTCPEHVINMQVGEDEGFIGADQAHADDTAHYVANDAIAQKASYSYTLATNGLSKTLTGLPAGVTVRCNGVKLVTDTEPTTLIFDVPGTYTLRLSGKAEYLDETLEVTIG